jgi:hypothetical protein
MHRPRTPLRGLVLLAALLVASPLAAEERYAAASDALVSFDRFTQGRVNDLRMRADRARRHPRVRPGAARPLVTWRGVGLDFETEIARTGRSEAPWVGVLRYSEQVYTCEDVDAQTCRVASVRPVAEVYRFVRGEWRH